MEKYKKLCTEDDCYTIVTEIDIERNEDGRPYPRSLKCWHCRTEQDKAAIKKFRKKIRKLQTIAPNVVGTTKTVQYL